MTEPPAAPPSTQDSDCQKCGMALWFGAGPVGICVSPYCTEAEPPAAPPFPSRLIILPLDWARERLHNCEVIIYQKTGADRNGWEEDAMYWRAIIDTLASAEATAQQLAALREKAQAAIDTFTDEFDFTLRPELAELRAALQDSEAK